jgi:hypothetical protein
MFAGHYAAAIAAKAAEPRAPFWLLAGACQLVDIAWAAFIMAGVESAAIDNSLPGSPLVLGHMPWTHSLPAALAWSLGAFAAARWALNLPARAAAITALAVASHWLLDLIVHRPDLPLWPGGPLAGFGLWNLEVAEQAVEIGLIALASLFWGAARQKAGLSVWPAAAFVLLLLVVQITALFTPLEDIPLQMGGMALATYLGVTLAAAFADRRLPQSPA